MAGRIYNDDVDYSFITFDGVPQLASYEVKEIEENPGAAGVAYNVIGFKGPEFEVVSITGATDTSAVSAAIIAYNALKSSIVTVVDDLGISWTNILIIDVTITRRQKILRPVGDMAGYNYLIETRWRMRPTATYY